MKTLVESILSGRASAISRNKDISAFDIDGWYEFYTEKVPEWQKKIKNAGMMYGNLGYCTAFKFAELACAFSGGSFSDVFNDPKYELAAVKILEHFKNDWKPVRVKSSKIDATVYIHIPTMKKLHLYESDIVVYIQNHTDEV